MTNNTNEFTGSPDIWSEPTPAPDGTQQLAAYLEQGFRNHARGMHLAGHPGLHDAAAKHLGELDLSKPDGANAWYEKIADTLETPEANGMGGMFADLLAEQRRMGLID